MREGLYKVDFHTVHGTGCGVVNMVGGKMRGGNSAFAFIGTYTGADDSLKAKISTERYNHDPAFRPLFGTDRITRGGDQRQHHHPYASSGQRFLPRARRVPRRGFQRDSRCTVPWRPRAPRAPSGPHPLLNMNAIPM